MCSMINAYGKAYEVTGKAIYRAKAEDLANTMTASQFVDGGNAGLIPTVMRKRAEPEEVWINCLVNDAHALLTFDELIQKQPSAPGH
jgi:hypothetical protein